VEPPIVIVLLRFKTAVTRYVAVMLPATADWDTAIQKTREYENLQLELNQNGSTTIVALFLDHWR
jgi:hypothetical protein